MQEGYHARSEMCRARGALGMGRGTAWSACVCNGWDSLHCAWFVTLGRVFRAARFEAMDGVDRVGRVDRAAGFADAGKVCRCGPGLCGAGLT